jgi:DNA-directed RNA polymerase subunit RPC12/RpoP
MELICAGCGARLVVPDERIPIEGTVQVGCPRCKAKISLGGRPQSESLPEELFYEEGVKIALIMDRDPVTSAAAKEAAERLGFKTILPSNLDAALTRLNAHQIELLILADGFDGRPLRQSPIMEHLNRLPMAGRRRMLVILTADGFRTGDAMEAFSLSADAVASKRDLSRIEEILKHAFAEKERLYKSFKEIAAESGRY